MEQVNVSQIKSLKERTVEELYHTFRRVHGKETAMWFAREVYDAFHECEGDDIGHENKT